MADLQSEFRRTQVVPALALALACVGAASMVYYHLGLFIPRALQVRASIGLGNGYSFGDDFYPIWFTARESRLGDHDIYGYETTRQIQIGLFGRPVDPHRKSDPPIDYRQYSYPAFTDLILWPAAFLDFPQLRMALTLLLPTLSALSIWMWLKALRWKIHPMWAATIMVLTLSTYQLLEAFFALQPGLFVGFFLAAAALAIRSNRLMLAGGLCSLTLIKPQVTMLAILYLLLWSLSDRTRARFWQGFLLVTAALMIGSLAIWPHWIGQWMTVLLGYHHYAMPPLINILLGPSLSRYIAPVVIAAMLALAIGSAWRNRRAAQDSARFWFTLSVVLAITTITLLPGQAIYDHIILIPAILLLLRYARELAKAGRIGRALLLAGGLVLTWPWISAFVLLVIRPWLSSQTFYAVPVFALPMRTAASLPFAVLVLLAWTWKVIPGSRAA
jgi:hypothetical protein